MNNDLKNYTILYIEDEKQTRDSYVRLFERLFKEVYSASNGEVGLNLFKKKSPDIILTDSKMPIMGGFEMSEKIRKIDKNIPIIFVSAQNENHFVEKLKSININSCLLKPVSRDDLKTGIADAIKKSQNIV